MRNASNKLLFNFVDLPIRSPSFHPSLTFSLFSFKPHSPNRPDYNPISIPIAERPSTSAPRTPEIDRTLLNSLSFIPPRSNPIKFLAKFESSFKSTVLQDEKCVWLKKFVPPYDHSRFDPVFIGDRDTSFDRFRRLFISAYFRPYAQFRKASLSLRFEDIASIVEFVKRKIEIYETVEELSPQQATERVFFELPVPLAEEFLLRNPNLAKETLIQFVTFSDFVIEAHYRQITERAGTSSIRDDRESGDQANRPPVFDELATQHRSVGEREKSLFLNLNSDTDDDLDEELEGDSLSQSQLDHLSQAIASSRDSSSRKRVNSTSTLSLRKEKSSGSAPKRRNK